MRFSSVTHLKVACFRQSQMNLAGCFTLWCHHASNQVCLKSYSLKVLNTIISASQILNPHYRFRSCLMSKIHQQLSSTVNRSSTVQFNRYSTQYHSWNSLNYYSIQQSKIIQLFTGWWYSYPEKSWSMTSNSWDDIPFHSQEKSNCQGTRDALPRPGSGSSALVGWLVPDGHLPHP